MGSRSSKETIMMPVDDIRFEQAYYPRGKPDDARIADYRENIDRLPPIVVTHEGYLVDGNHRLLAHRLAGRERIPVEVITLPQDRILEEAARRNATGILPLSAGDRQALALRWWDDGNGKSEQEIADILSVSIRQVQRYLEDSKARIEQRRSTRITKLYLEGHKQAEIVSQVALEFPKAYHVSQSQVSRTISTRWRRVSQTHKPPSSRQVYNIWRFPNCDPKYGQKGFPGRKPGQIIENLLYYYTEPGDLVIDPMAGSGTTLDVCLEMDRRCLAYDLNPVRNEIRDHNITSGYPPECKDAALVFLDPPYWGYLQGQYADFPGQLGDMLSLEKYYEAMEAIFQASRGVLKPGGHLAVIIAATRQGNERIDHAAEFLRRLEDFDLVDRVIVEFSVTIYTAREFDQAKQCKKMLEAYQDLIIVRRP